MEIVKKKEYFALIIDKNIKIFEHSHSSPCMFIGIGKPKIDMHRGNFQIEDYIYEKLPLDVFSLKEKPREITVTFSRDKLYTVKVVFKEENGKLIVQFHDVPAQINRLWLRLAAVKDEHVYGCGEQFSYFDLRGKNFPLWTSEQGVGRNKNTMITFLADKHAKAGGDYFWTFFPQPTFVSSRKYYCHVDGTAYMDFDFKNESYHELQFWNVPRKIVFETGGSYIEIVRKITELLGKQPELPEWIYNGVILGIQGGTDVCLKKLDHALSKGLKVGGIWAQDWQGIRITSFGKRLMWNWIWNRELYPGLDEEIKKLKERGVRFLGYINPYVAEEGKLYKEASKKKIPGKD